MSAADTLEPAPGMAGQDMQPGLAAVRHLARHQVMGLASVLLLGMAINLIGLPSPDRRSRPRRQHRVP